MRETRRRPACGPARFALVLAPVSEREARAYDQGRARCGTRTPRVVQRARRHERRCAKSSLATIRNPKAHRVAPGPVSGTRLASSYDSGDGVGLRH